MNTITREEAAALLEAATPGPWRNDPPKDDGSAPIPWRVAPENSAPFNLAVDVWGDGWSPRIEADADLIAAAPSLAHTVVALHERIAELEATLAAERGDPAGALPGREWLPGSRVVVVEPATACPNEIPGGGGARVVCADPESCAKHGCGYLESLADAAVPS